MQIKSERNVQTLYKIRNKTYQDRPLLEKLGFMASGYEAKLHRNGIYPTDIFIWIKEYNGQTFPKIEFNIAGEELQYDMCINSNILEISEVHFKTFIKHPDGSIERTDVPREAAHVTLQAIDVILQS